MQIIVSTRHGEISDRLRKTVDRQFGRMSRYESRISKMEVTLTNESNHWEVEALASIDRAKPVHSHGESKDVRDAVDQAVDKMTRQLKRLRGRHKDHQGPSSAAQSEIFEGGP